ELGEYDGTALMEFKTRKTVIYRIKDETACTYDYDDTPPFQMNREALDIALEIALMLKMNVVGELHIARKQYLDGSIPAGFQRTGIIAIEGSIPLSNKTVRIIQLSVEEDSCREVSDIGHVRVFTTDRLGMPLMEMVTYPDMLTPDEAAEAGQYLRFVARSSGKVRTGMGAAREDVNVSITGGTRVEIKGVSHIRWIPRLVHTEAFRQKALLLIRDELKKRVVDPKTWRLAQREIDYGRVPSDHPLFQRARAAKMQLTVVNLPKFAGLLSHFTQPGQTFADELSGRLKVIACIEKPNMTHSEDVVSALTCHHWSELGRLLSAEDDDAQVLVFGPADDISTALDVIEERCRLAMEGVPNETRKGLADGTNIFERVLPGPDRMYPDTDSAPISIDNDRIEAMRQELPVDVAAQIHKLREWRVPKDTWVYLLKRNLVDLVERIVKDFEQDPVFVGSVIGHTLKHVEGISPRNDRFRYDKIYELFRFGKAQKLYDEILKVMVPILYNHPHLTFESVLTAVEFSPYSMEQILSQVPSLRREFAEERTSPDPKAEVRWLMGSLRRCAIGNVCLEELRARVEKEVGNV
ncbi:MAG TPA: Glu-tRNA(Gln) amidotransferase subunit GatE, partial [Candidatus Acidoferrum sp.]|nr:Glu-tRNA(Gln) amidotransferase subunit GatE [Candidatus Acidoferrum sp.]